MSLSRYRLNASVAVSDMGRRGSYKDGSVSPLNGREPTAAGYRCGGDTAPARVPIAVACWASRPRRWPPGTWTTSSASFDELVSDGVTFEHYEGVDDDAKGISPRAGGGKVAWFKDPDGNTFAVEGDR